MMLHYSSLDLVVLESDGIGRLNQTDGYLKPEEAGAPIPGYYATKEI